MTPRWSHIDKTLQTIEQATSLDEVMTILRDYAVERGFVGATYFEADPWNFDIENQEQDSRIWVSGIETFVDEYIQHNIAADDAFLKKAYNSILPVEVGPHVEMDGLTKEEIEAQKRIWKLAEKHGFHSSLFIPVHHKVYGQPISVISLFCFPWRGSLDKFKKATKKWSIPLHVLSLHAGQRLIDIESQPDQDKLVLSNREKDCLVLTALGKTSPEVAEILGISEATVNFHIKNVCRKFGVRSRIHAAAQAVSKRIIHIA